MRTYAARRVGELYALAALALLPSACAPKPEPVNGAGIRENALVRFVNVATFKEPVDLYRGETRVLLEVAKNKVTDYSEWPAERHDIELRTTGTAKPIAASSESLIAGQRYTVVGYNKTDGTYGVAFFRENISRPEGGKARLRVIHVADGAAELDVFPAGAENPLVEGVDYKMDISAEIDPDVKALEIRNEGERIVSVKIRDLSLDAGRTYTIIVAADGESNLRAIQADNTPPIRESYLTN